MVGTLRPNPDLRVGGKPLLEMPAGGLAHGVSASIRTLAPSERPPPRAQ
jgi:hypothetical protein